MYHTKIQIFKIWEIFWLILNYPAPPVFEILWWEGNLYWVNFVEELFNVFGGDELMVVGVYKKKFQAEVIDKFFESKSENCCNHS